MSHDRAGRGAARLVVLTALIWAGPLCGVPAQAASGSLALTECSIEGYGGLGSAEARCGTLQVPENTAEPQGRINGAVVRVGRQINVLTPVNHILWQTVKSLENGGELRFDMAPTNFAKRRNRRAPGDQRVNLSTLQQP